MDYVLSETTAGIEEDLGQFLDKTSLTFHGTAPVDLDSQATNSISDDPVDEYSRAMDAISDGADEYMLALVASVSNGMEAMLPNESSVDDNSAKSNEHSRVYNFIVGDDDDDDEEYSLSDESSSKQSRGVSDCSASEQKEFKKRSNQNRTWGWRKKGIRSVQSSPSRGGIVLTPKSRDVGDRGGSLIQTVSNAFSHVGNDKDGENSHSDSITSSDGSISSGHSTSGSISSGSQGHFRVASHPSKPKEGIDVHQTWQWLDNGPSPLQGLKVQQTLQAHDSDLSTTDCLSHSGGVMDIIDTSTSQSQQTKNAPLDDTAKKAGADQAILEKTAQTALSSLEHTEKSTANNEDRVMLSHEIFASESKHFESVETEFVASLMPKSATNFGLLNLSKSGDQGIEIGSAAEDEDEQEAVELQKSTKSGSIRILQALNRIAHVGKKRNNPSKSSGEKSEVRQYNCAAT